MSKFLLKEKKSERNIPIIFLFFFTKTATREGTTCSRSTEPTFGISLCSPTLCSLSTASASSRPLGPRKWNLFARFPGRDSATLWPPRNFSRRDSREKKRRKNKKREIIFDAVSRRQKRRHRDDELAWIRFNACSIHFRCENNLATNRAGTWKLFFGDLRLWVCPSLRSRRI